MTKRKKELLKDVGKLQGAIAQLTHDYGVRLKEIDVYVEMLDIAKKYAFVTGYDKLIDRHEVTIGDSDKALYMAKQIIELLNERSGSNKFEISCVESLAEFNSMISGLQIEKYDLGKETLRLKQENSDLNSKYNSLNREYRHKPVIDESFPFYHHAKNMICSSSEPSLNINDEAKAAEMVAAIISKIDAVVDKTDDGYVIYRAKSEDDKKKAKIEADYDFYYDGVDYV